MGVPTLAAVRRAILLAAFTFAAASVALAAGPGDLARESARTEVLFLGTAGGPPLRLDRSEPSTLLIVDGRPYLIDCGIGTMRRLLRAGVESEQVRTIFFTHLHGDHDFGLADVMANDFFRQSMAGQAQPINIYGPPQTKELVNAAFHFITVGFRPFENFPPRTDGSYQSPFVTHEIDRDGVVFQDDKIRVTAAENSHYALMPPQRRAQFKSFSYRIETPHGVIVFTGDTGPSEAVERLAKGADVLVAEANTRGPQDAERFTASMAARNHWPPQQAKAFRAHFEVEHLDTYKIGHLAAKAQVKAVLLYHYVPGNKADQAAYVTGVRTAFSGPVFAPDDLDRYCLGGGGLSRCAH
ncbi:MAG TPA: MBL fold metallo-hydrolase [Steroidobacteraceae bacterium]|nr:MBL fold metallo-hydrolase [Steroidobacteraceae bacterium]